MRQKVTIPAAARLMAEDLFDELDIEDYAAYDCFYRLDDVGEQMFDEWLDKDPNGEYTVLHNFEWFMDVLIYQIGTIFAPGKLFARRSYRLRLKYAWKNVRFAFDSLRKYGEFTLNARQFVSLSDEYSDAMSDAVSDYQYDANPRNHPSLSAAQRNGRF